jgi:hypothetical protein
VHKYSSNAFFVIYAFRALVFEGGAKPKGKDNFLRDAVELELTR